MKKFLLLVLNMAAALSLFTFSTGASAQIGSLSTDLVFNPVTPCRIMDTREPGGKSGILVAGTTRSFFGWSTTFAGQGGAATSCGILQTTNLAAIVVNFTVVAPTAAGYITAFPVDAAQPTAATVNFTAGSVVGNNATLKVNQTGTGDEFKIFTTASVHVVGDVVGYYAQPVATAIACNTVTGTAVTVAANTYATIPTLSCPSGATALNLSFSGSSDVLMGDSFISGIVGSMSVRNVSATSQSVTGRLLCCKIPGR